MKANNPTTETPTGTSHSPVSAAGSPMAVGSAAMQAWMDMGAEAVRFVLDRLQQDIKTQQAMLACRSLEEIQKVQAEFIKSAQDQYTAEARKMLELIGKTTTAGVPASKVARKYDDVPL